MLFSFDVLWQTVAPATGGNALFGEMRWCRSHLRSLETPHPAPKSCICFPARTFVQLEIQGAAGNTQRQGRRRVATVYAALARSLRPNVS